MHENVFAADYYTDVANKRRCGDVVGIAAGMGHMEEEKGDR
jgi:hypothetical protein